MLPSAPTKDHSTSVFDTKPSAAKPGNQGLLSATSGHVYRLQKISEIQKEIENERERRNKLSKKFH